MSSFSSCMIGSSRVSRVPRRANSYFVSKIKYSSPIRYSQLLSTTAVRYDAVASRPLSTEPIMDLDLT